MSSACARRRITSVGWNNPSEEARLQGARPHERYLEGVQGDEVPLVGVWGYPPITSLLSSCRRRRHKKSGDCVPPTYQFTHSPGPLTRTVASPSLKTLASSAIRLGNSEKLTRCQ